MMRPGMSFLSWGVLLFELRGSMCKRTRLRKHSLEASNIILVALRYLGPRAP